MNNVSIAVLGYVNNIELGTVTNLVGLVDRVRLLLTLLLEPFPHLVSQSTLLWWWVVVIESMAVPAARLSVVSAWKPIPSLECGTPWDQDNLGMAMRATELSRLRVRERRRILLPSCCSQIKATSSDVTEYAFFTSVVTLDRFGDKRDKDSSGGWRCFARGDDVWLPSA